MPLFGKPSRKKRQRGFFSDPVASDGPRERAAAARVAVTEAAAEKLKTKKKKKKEADRQALVDRAEELKEAAQKRREEAAAKRKREAAARARAAKPAPEKTACTCHKPQLDRSGKCRRCHKVPASRRGGLFR